MVTRKLAIGAGLLFVLGAGLFVYLSIWGADGAMRMSPGGPVAPNTSSYPDTYADLHISPT